MSESGFQIEGSKIVLVPFTEKYLQDSTYLNWIQDYEVIKYINRKEYLMPATAENLNEYISSMNKSSEHHFFAILLKTTNKFIGTFKFASLNWQDKSVGLGVLIGDRSHWGEGIATEAFNIAIEYAFTKLGMRKVTAGCVEPNIGMKKNHIETNLTLELV